MGETSGNPPPAALFIAPIMPSDRGNGLAMRAGFFLDAYAKYFDIDLAVIPVAGGPLEPTSFVTAYTRRAIVLPPGPPDTYFALIAGVADAEARLASFRQYARPSITAGLSAELGRSLMAHFGETSYALVHVFRLYLAGMAAPWLEERHRPRSIVLDCDEDDASAYRRLAVLYRSEGHGRRADWAEAEADAFKRLAADWLPRFGLLLAASSGEARLLAARAGLARVKVVPNVAPENAAKPARRTPRSGCREILFVGNMGYPPNIDAALWFGLHIWPALSRAVPFPVRFVIAGPGAPRRVTNLAKRPGISVVGGVDAVGPLYRRASLAVVPIRAGGGTRIKLLEGASYGVPMVSTRFGAAGTCFRSGHELLLADSAREFARSCARLLTDGALASRLAARASRTVNRAYNPARCAARLRRLVDVHRNEEWV